MTQAVRERGVVVTRRAARRRRSLRQILEGWGFVAPATFLILGSVDLPGGLGVPPVDAELERIQ